METKAEKVPNSDPPADAIVVEGFVPKFDFCYGNGDDQDDSAFVFSHEANPVPILEFKNNGEVYVGGRFATNDMEVVEGIKHFISSAKKSDEAIFTEEFLKEELADAGKMYLVSDQQLRRLLRYSTVTAFHDCRTNEVSAELLHLIERVGRLNVINFVVDHKE